MSTNIQEIKEVIAVCNEFIDSKILFADRKIQKIMEAIVKSNDVYELIGECVSAFNKDKEFDKAFTKSSTGKGYFTMPKEEFKVIALTFCLLADINNSNVSFDEIVAKFFVNEEGKKDYSLFMQKVIVPFRDLISEAFGVSSHITTVEAIDEMKDQEEEISFGEEEEEEKEEEFILGKSRFVFKDLENLDRTFELSKSISMQIFDLLEAERKITDIVMEARTILNSVVIACDKKDFEMLNSLVIGLKGILKNIKSVRFLGKELADVVSSQLYCN